MTASLSSRQALAVVLTCAACGCATHLEHELPSTDPARYAGWDCERLREESDRVQLKAADVAYTVDERIGSRMVPLSGGVTVFWPALMAMRPDGAEAQQLATLKGSFEALQTAAQRSDCALPAQALNDDRGATRPLRAGERFVYEERAGRRAQTKELGLRVVALRRDHVEFAPDLAGHALPGLWSQDLAGNTRPDSRAPLLSWRRLLKPDLQLGQVLIGELYSADTASMGPARVRGQVVAQGVQQVVGRSFDVVVIELFGDAPTADGGFARLSGMMAVDRASGLLLRLELSCSNPAFAMRRQLTRVEPSAG